MKLFKILLAVCAVLCMNADASIRDKKDFDRNYPAKYDNVVSHFVRFVYSMSSINQLKDDTPFIEMLPPETETTSGTRSSTSRSTVIPPTPKYPNALSDFQAEGYKPNNIMHCHWYSLTPHSSWSLDDNENFDKLINEYLPIKDDWKDAEIIPKGKEIKIAFILMNKPPVERLGKFRTSTKPYSSSSRLVVQAYRREQAKAQKAIYEMAQSGYAFISFKDGDTRRGGWIKASSLVNGKKKKRR